MLIYVLVYQLFMFKLDFSFNFKLYFKNLTSSSCGLWSLNILTLTPGSVYAFQFVSFASVRFCEIGAHNIV